MYPLFLNNILLILKKWWRLIIPQQQMHFFTLSYGRGLRLEKKIFHTNGFKPKTMGSNVWDLVALIIRFALHGTTWDLWSQVRSVMYMQHLIKCKCKCMHLSLITVLQPLNTISNCSFLYNYKTQAFFPKPGSKSLFFMLKRNILLQPFMSNFYSASLWICPISIIVPSVMRLTHFSPH